MNNKCYWTNLQLAPVLALGLFTGALSADTALWNVTVDVHFEGTSTLHGFEGAVSADRVELAVETAAGGTSATLNASVEINVANMSTHHEKRDKNMYTMFSYKEFATINGTLTNAVVTADEDCKVELLLKICNEQHPVDAVISHYSNRVDGVAFDLAFPVSLKTFGLKPPSVLGMVRVGDEVAVRCHVRPKTDPLKGQ